MSATPDSNAASLESAIAQTAELALERVSGAREAIGRVIFGQEKVVEEVMVTLMAGGHGLLVGVPGLAKTKLVDTLGVVLGLDARRVQFTPDLQANVPTIRRIPLMNRRQAACLRLRSRLRQALKAWVVRGLLVRFIRHHLPPWVCGGAEPILTFDPGMDRQAPRRA